MWSWVPWPIGQGRDIEKEDTNRQPKMAEGQRQTQGLGFYQRNKTGELSAETVGLDRGQRKHPGGARREGGTPHSQQLVGNADIEEDWEKVDHEDLKKLQARQSGKAKSQVIPSIQEPKYEHKQEKEALDDSYTALDQALKDNQELQRKQAEALKRVAELENRNRDLRTKLATKEAELRSEVPASSGPASTLSTDSEGYYTPYSSLSENGSEHRTLVQTGTNDSGLLLKLQKENVAKGDTINKLEREVNQLKKRLKYAEQLEEQNLRFATEESKHEEEKQTLRREVESLKRKASVSRPLTRSYAHEQKLQELAQLYEQQYHEELDENSRLREKISQLEREMQGQEEGPTRIDEVDDPDLNAELRRKDQHVHTLQAQVEGLQQHSKGQSKQILHLKQELEALKVAGEEIDTSWRIMVDQLEEENRKLSMDVGALHRDKKFLVQSMETTKARNEDLEPLAQKFQVQLEEVIQKEELARKQLESMTGSNERAHQKCQQLEAENKQLTEQISKLGGASAAESALINQLLHQTKKLEQEKETLQNEVQIAKTEAQVYREDFDSERRDREAAHGKFADLQKKYPDLQKKYADLHTKYDQDVGELKAELTQMKENLYQHEDRLVEVEQVNQRREREMRSLLEEASKNQQEVQAKTSQVKQYKKQVDSLKDQVAELQKHNEDLIQEMDRVMTEMENKLKTGKPKKKASDADDSSKFVELEGRNKELEGRNRELLKEREKLFKELEKTRKELLQAKSKAEAEKPKKDAKKGKKDAKKKSDTGVTSPEPTEVSKTLDEKRVERQQSYEVLRDENATLRDELEHYRRENENLKTRFTRGPKNLLPAQSRESSQSPLTSPMADLPRASDPGQPPPRILEEDEEIEQEKIKQTLDLNFRKQWQPFQSMEEQTSTAGAGTLPGQAILKANAPQYAYEHPPPAEYFHEHPLAGGFAAQLNVRSGADIGPAPVQLTNQQPPPRPPKPSPTPPTMSPSDSEIHQLPPPHAGGPQGKPPYSQQIPQDSTCLGAPGIPPQPRTYPQTPPMQHWKQSHPLSSQYPPQYGGTEMPHQKLIPNQCSVGGGFEQQTLVPQGRQGDQMQGSGKPRSSYQQHLRSPEDQYPTSQHSLSAPLPRMDPTDPRNQPNPKQFESYKKSSRLDQNLDSIIHAQAETVVTEVGDESSRQLTMHHIPYDPNLTCPMCNKRFRIGEIQKYRAHVNKQCTGTQEVTDL